MSLNYTLASSEKDFAFISKLNSIKTLRGIKGILSQNLSPSRQNLANLRLDSMNREIRTKLRHNNYIRELKELFSMRGMTQAPFPTLENRDNLEETDVYFVSFKHDFHSSVSTISSCIGSVIVQASSYEKAITNFICDHFSRNHFTVYHKKASSFFEDGYVVRRNDGEDYHYAFHAIKYSDWNSDRLKELALPFYHDEDWRYPDIEKFNVKRGYYKWRTTRTPNSHILYDNIRVTSLCNNYLDFIGSPYSPLLVMLGFSKKELSSFAPAYSIPIEDIRGSRSSVS